MKNDADKNDELFDHYSTSYASVVDNSVAFTGLNVDFFTKVKAGYIVDLCDTYGVSTDSAKVLDVGCGVGGFHDLLGDKFDKLHGVDVSIDSVNKANKSHPDVEYKIYDGQQLPYNSNYFEVVFAICVLHHVPTENWQKFVNEMFRVAKKGGLVMIFEHNPRNPLTMKAVNNCPFDADAILLKSEETSKMMRDSGLGQVNRKYILSVPAANRLLRRVDGVFSGLRLGAQYVVSGIKPVG